MPVKKIKVGTEKIPPMKRGLAELTKPQTEVPQEVRSELIARPAHHSARRMTKRMTKKEEHQVAGT